MIAAVYAGADDGSLAAVHVHIVHLRKALAPTRAVITTTHCRGYALTMKEADDVSFLTPETCRTERLKAEQLADTLYALAHSAGKGVSDHCEALAASLMDTATNWGRMESAVKGALK
jgi:DNA-binding winged helix-turn-helix (wHTH) protein